MLSFRYSRFLEEQNRRLYDRIEALETRNQELVLAIVNKTPISQILKPEGPKHHIKKTTNSASCSCGWNSASNDPAELQQNIQIHFRSYSAPTPVRKSWPQIKSMAESEGEIA